jgi:hypothetical protein
MFILRFSHEHRSVLWSLAGMIVMTAFLGRVAAATDEAATETVAVPE